ncbi:hypothetical protein OB236_14290 [Paenibacillus sp. WQ 127069]|uniref:Uncharacterized protein n=1 Tax=Paenibacillus baimaensis TaxID=2982185 RepID=A0ABT2UF94_9BACL|nr:hypothetical protein [Paenibacillus sp. WQ 127069]MCU6793285.1 hypothetical protein [Paenibacillus sp. WQ 127069]
MDSIAAVGGICGFYPFYLERPIHCSSNEKFPQTGQDGVNVKPILGEGSLVLHLPNRILAGLSIRGTGGSIWVSGQEPTSFKNKEFAIV